MNNLNNNGNINKVYITDNSNNLKYKQLNQCNQNELTEQHQKRYQLYKDEVKNKKQYYFKFSLFISFLSTGISTYLYFIGKEDMAKFILAVGGFIMPIILYNKGVEQQSEFERRQIDAINEINYLLRERNG
jgi:hypothetical protein